MLKKFKLLSTILAIIIVVLPLSGLNLYHWMNSETFQVAGEIINRVETEEKVVALTFDDGPTEYTQGVLDLLAEKQVVATFYVIGQDVEKHPDVTKNIVAAGHELGNHSYSHQRMIFKPKSFIEEEVEKTNKLIRDAGYKGEITFRPPFGKKLVALPLYLGEQNIKTITWDVEPLKFLSAEATTEEIVAYSLENTERGSIILIHPWYGKTNPSREAIGPIIDQLKADGYELVTVSELLKKNN